VQQGDLTPQIQSAVQHGNVRCARIRNSATCPGADTPAHAARISSDSRDFGSFIALDPAPSPMRHSCRGGFSETRQASRLGHRASYSRIDLTRRGEGSTNCPSSLFPMSPKRDSGEHTFTRCNIEDLLTSPGEVRRSRE
jgi:hypothetical protein